MTKFLLLIFSFMISVSSLSQREFYEFVTNEIPAYIVRNNISEIKLSREELNNTKSEYLNDEPILFFYDSKGKLTEFSKYTSHKYNINFNDTSKNTLQIKHFWKHKDEITSKEIKKELKIDSINYYKEFKINNQTIQHLYAFDNNNKLLKEQLEYSWAYPLILYDLNFKVLLNEKGWPQKVYFFYGFAEDRWRHKFDTIGILDYYYHDNKIVKTLNNFNPHNDKYEYKSDTIFIWTDKMNKENHQDSCIEIYDIDTPYELYSLATGYGDLTEIIYRKEDQLRCYLNKDRSLYIERKYNEKFFIIERIYEELTYVFSYEWTEKLDTSKKLLRNICIQDSTGKILIKESYNTKTKKWIRTNYYYEGENLFGEEQFEKRINTKFSLKQSKLKYKLISSLFLTDEYINNYFKELEQQGYKVEIIKN